MGEKRFVTDMNDRERTRLAEAFDMLAEQAGMCATALREGDDAKVLAGGLIFGLAWAGISPELTKILKAGQQVEVPDHAGGAETP